MTGEWEVVEELAVEVDRRHLKMQASQTIRTVEDALIELITNSDDAYGELGDEDSPVMVVVRRRHAGSQLEVRDRAGGMSEEVMRRKILRYGSFVAGKDSRGFMGRGAKDVVALGDATFESVKGRLISKVDISPDFQARRYRPRVSTTEELRELRLKKNRGGTRVTLTLSRGKTMPLFDHLSRDLQRHYALRDMTRRRTIKLVDANQHNEVVLRYTPPVGELVADEIYAGTNPYADATAALKIWAAPEELPSDLREGIIVCDERAVHQVTRFAADLDQDPVARQLFGRLECLYIRRLQLEFEELREQGKTPPPHNPLDVVDPNRRRGLDRDNHPFVKHLFDWAEETLRKVVDRIKAEKAPEPSRVANEETARRLKQLSKAVAQHLKERLEEEQLATRTPEQTAALQREGVLLNPQFQRMAVGEKKRLGYTVLSLGKDEDPSFVTVDVEGTGISLSTRKPQLRQIQRDPERLIAYFDLEATALSDKTTITVRHPNDIFPVAKRELTVGEAEDLFAARPPGLSFDYGNFTVHDGGTRTLGFAAKGDKFRSVDWTKREITKVNVASDCLTVLRGGNLHVHQVAANVWTGEVQIRGRGVGRRGVVTLSVALTRGDEATDAMVKVVSREEPPEASISIELVPESGGQWRAQWDRANPNRLKVFAKHPTLARYLGDEVDGYPEQNLPHFRVLMAEVVADKVVQRIMQERLAHEVQLAENPDKLFFMQSEEMTTFLPLAHRIMLSDAEARALRNGNGEKGNS